MFTKKLQPRKQPTQPMLFSFLRFLFTYLLIGKIPQSEAILLLSGEISKALPHKLPRHCHADIIGSAISSTSQRALVHFFFITVIFSSAKLWNLSQAGSIESFLGKRIKSLCSDLLRAGGACAPSVS